jgi:hypothetical protein
MIRPAYTASEAAAIINIGRAWLIQKAASEAGPLMGAHRTGGSSGHWRFDPDKFDRYVQDLRAGKVIANKPGRRRRAPRKPRNVQMEEWLARFRAPLRKAG